VREPCAGCAFPTTPPFQRAYCMGRSLTRRTGRLARGDTCAARAAIVAHTALQQSRIFGSSLPTHFADAPPRPPRPAFGTRPPPSRRLATRGTGCARGRRPTGAAARAARSSTTTSRPSSAPSPPAPTASASAATSTAARAPRSPPACGPAGWERGRGQCEGDEGPAGGSGARRWGLGGWRRWTRGDGGGAVSVEWGEGQHAGKCEDYAAWKQANGVDPVQYLQVWGGFDCFVWPKRE
jgi:hypothetical protein